jgi:C4-dicarboxylate transporter, DctM subunit
MAVEWIGAIGIICVFLLMFLRVPIVIAMAVPSIIGLLFLQGWETVVSSIQTIVWQQTASYTFSSIPMFILMGELLFMSGVSVEIFDMLKKLFGRIKGGLGISTIGASAFFAAVTGSSLATIGTIGPSAFKEMTDAGYNQKLSSGSIAAAGTLGILIPPSTMMILYGIMTDTSIGKLFMAGIIPGIILAILFMLTFWVASHFLPATQNEYEKVSWKQKISNLRSVFWILALFALVVGGIYLGWFSPIESGGIGAFGALIIVLFKRKLTLQSLYSALLKTVKTSTLLFAIIIGGFILNQFLVVTQIPKILTNFLTNTPLTPTLFLITLIIIYIFLGALMDATAMMTVTIPIVMPLLHVMGIDMIWYGILFIIILELAFITPPIGINCFVLNGIIDLKLGDIFKGVAIFIIPIIVLIGLLFIFPEIALFLPNSMM